MLDTRFVPGALQGTARGFLADDRSVPANRVPAPFSVKLRDPVWYVYMILRILLTVAPIAFGLDKYFNLLTYWPKYLASVVNDIAPMGGQPFMYVVGGVEIMLGLIVAIVPRYGAPMVAGWLDFIIGNLLLIGDYYDVALRDFGLLSAALALFLLTFHRPASSAANEQEYDHV